MSSLKVRNMLNQIDPNAILIAQKIAKKDLEMKDTHRKLEDLRLQTESQNTRLIRIQQDERKATEEYKKKKNDMEKILEELAVRAENFNEEQKKIYEDLEAKRDPVIIKNDLRKKQEEDKLKRDRSANREKKETIKSYKLEKEQKENELKSLERELKRYRKYEDFLKSANDNVEESKNDEKSIIELISRYEKLRLNQIEFGQRRDRIEMEKDQVSLQITALTKVMEDATYSFTSTINALKTETDQINQENRKFEMEIENKILFANSKFSEYGKIVLAIRNLDILSKSWRDSQGAKQEEKIDNSAETTDKLTSTLMEIKKRLKFLSDVSKEICEKWDKQGK